MILWRKMVRDMRSNVGSYLACLVLVVLGMAAYLSFAIARDNMVFAKEQLYREQNFADGFADLVAIPEHYVGRIRRLPGIERATGRLIKDVRVYDRDPTQSTYLRLVSIDPAEPDRLNDVMLLDGEPLADRELQGWLDQQFFRANNLQLGRSVEIIAGGRVRELEVVGVGISPEFVYPMRTETDIYHNPEQFGIAFVPLETMWRLFTDHDRAFNSVVFSMSPETDFEELREQLELELDRYGVLEIYPRADQTSHFILREEIDIINTLATFFPVIILLVAGFIIYIVLKRLVQQQRGQIGILKAFGYSRRHILFHYLCYSLSLAVLGGAVGGLVGMWLATPLTDMLYEFFHLPPFYVGFSWRHLALSILICLGVLGFAGYQGCKRVLRLAPAEAMQPPAPVIGRHNLLEKLSLFSSMLTVQGKMAIRNISRSRSRTGFVFFGLTVSCAMVAFTWALSNEMMPKFMFYHYEQVQTYDAKLTLEAPRCRRPGMLELQRRRDVAWVEPLAEVPVTLEHRWRREHVVAMGLAPDARLYNVLDVDGRRVVPGDDGLILSRRLADNLQARVGDTLKLESLYLRDIDDSVDVEVVGIIPQYIGMNAYIGIAGLERLLDQSPFATSFLVEFADGPGPDQRRVTELRQEYMESDYVAGVDSRLDQIELMGEYWEEAGWIMNMYVMIGVVFSFAIIYISSLVVLSERQRELASMRVLGMTSKEVLSVVTFEQWFIAFFAILAGMPLSWLILRAFAEQWSTDMYVMPVEMSAVPLVVGVGVTCASIWVAQRFAMRRIKRLRLVEALKTPE